MYNNAEAPPGIHLVFPLKMHMVDALVCLH